ncbi:MAG TPA: sialate O-acetylesterase, partial [Chthonomonadaceae bacterium]|nr:sialate O-acetylesterase [Chthonomonadaceae bacterium]
MISSQCMQGRWTLVTMLMICLLWTLGSNAAHADDNDVKPFLHPLFTDNMVWQRDIAAPIWGWTTPGATVTVRMHGKSAAAKADASGMWMAKLGPFPAGGPYDLSVSGPQSVTLKNVLTGDVWICSGQSNMEMGIGNVNNAQQEIAGADFPQIRLFTVTKKIAMEPEKMVIGKWDVCTPQTVAAGGWNGFSAAGYFFGRQLHQDLHIPIGLIHTSWGGTVAEAWTSAEALDTMSDFKPAVTQLQQTAEAMKSGQQDFNKILAAWWKKNDTGTALGYANTDFDSSAWKTMKLPTYWEQAGLPDYDGLVWFRREFMLPEGWQGKDLRLHLGPVDDNDTTYVNGVPVGATIGYNIPRHYTIPASALKPGKNVIAVSVLDTGGGGGIYGKAEDMKLELPGGDSPISLAGDWSYKDTIPLAKLAAFPQRVDNNPNVVTVLYNGMVAPLIPFGIK